MEVVGKGVELLKNIPRQYYLPIGLGCIGLILFAYGIGVTLTHNQSRENSQIPQFSQITPPPSLKTDFVIDVEGAVVKNGIYHVESTGRVADALIAAGGLSQEADRVWVAQHINLASKLTDGAKIYIPKIGEHTAVQAVAGASDSTISNDNSQVIDINSASLDSLDSLPGIGQVTAQKIVAGRPYSTIQDLVNKGIVGQKEFDKIKDLIVAQ